MRLETERYAHAAPVIQYEINASDVIVGVNDAWQSFAVANSAQHIMRDHVLGRSLWDFISDDTTRLVYDIVLRQVRDGGRSEFEYRCDSPDRKRLMQMTISPGYAGHVAFESATICVERHPAPSTAAASLARCCGWCKRAHAEGHGWLEVGASGEGSAVDGSGRAPAITNGMCSDCYRRVLNSVDESTRATASLAAARVLRAGRVVQAPRSTARRPARPAATHRHPGVVIPARHAS